MNNKLGIALSGGGVKGAAHIGVLRGLNEYNIYPSCISGTSSGSIVAAMYAAGFSNDDMLSIFEKYSTYSNGLRDKLVGINYLGVLKTVIGTFFSKEFTLEGIIKSDKLHKEVEKVFAQKGIHKISDIKMPLAICALDLNSGNDILFSNRNLPNSIKDVEIATAITASCAFPVVFTPVRYRKMLLVDGGVTNNLPVEQLELLGADYNISVVFNSQQDTKTNMIHIAERCITILRHRLEVFTDIDVDYLLKVTTTPVNLLELDKIDECYEAGYKCCVENIKNIYAPLRVKSL